MKADLLIKNSNVFNVYRKKFIQADIAIKGDKFFYVGNNPDLDTDVVIDASGKYVVPGFVDIHLHVESTMLLPAEFSAGIIAHGTTTAVTDPHEIANVFGVDGIKMMMEMDSGPADLFYGIPSSVPATPFETTGGKITPDNVRELLTDSKVLCLGEVMNFHELTADGDTNTKDLIAAMRERNGRAVIEGHCPRISGMDLQKFLYAGVDADHTQQTVESIIEKTGLGMFIELQAKSLTKELVNTILTEQLVEHCCLVTDDTMVDTLLYDGHLSRVYRLAVEMGLPVEEALYMSTYTPARRMGLTDRGCIAPGKIADFLIVDDINKLSLSAVYKNGKKIEHTLSLCGRRFPERFYDSINLSKLTAGDFLISADGDRVQCRVMEINPISTFTEEKHAELPVKNGTVDWENSGKMLVAVFDRYTGINKSFGFLQGTCLKRGAVATSYAHDHHNLLVVGSNVNDMVVAANTVIEMHGGMVAVYGNVVKCAFQLSVGGILSDKKLVTVADEMKRFKDSILELGWEHHNVIMSLATLSLGVSPALKITDRGLVDVKKGKIVPLFV